MLSRPLDSSFRDPSGFVFQNDGILYRQVNQVFESKYQQLLKSKLLDDLIDNGLLVSHQSVDLQFRASDDAIAVLKPDRLDFISYPYEWCFSQLQDAALLTLEVQRRALAKGMVLRDASAYNVQFRGAKPLFIDTLSFEPYTEGKPWVAYKQFCQHFLAPLVLMSSTDARAGLLLRVFIDGIPLDVASKLAPRKTRFKLGILLHLHGHANAILKEQAAGATSAGQTRPLSKQALQNIVANLESTIRTLKYEPGGTVWGNYYDHTNYSESSRKEKEQLVSTFIDLVEPKPKTLWDLGANTGEFSRISSGKGISTIAWDFDTLAVEKAYRNLKESGETHLLPLVQDLTNPSPALGWGHRERDSLEQRGPADVVMALALVHHLAIANNVPLAKIADYFARLGKSLIIEFVPKTDSQVQRLLSGREDIFDSYTQVRFEQDFSAYYDLVKKEAIAGSERTLYLYKRIDG